MEPPVLVEHQNMIDVFSDLVSVHPQYPIIWDPLEKNVARKTLQVNQIDKCWH